MCPPRARSFSRAALAVRSAAGHCPKIPESISRLSNHDGRFNLSKKKKKKFQELQPPVSIPSSSYHRTLLFSTSSKHPSTQDSPHIVLLQKLAALPGLGHFLTSPPRTIIPAIRSRLYVKPFFFLLFLSVAVLCYLFFLSQEMALARAR